MPDELVNTITQQGFHFGSPNFQDGFGIVSSRYVLIYHSKTNYVANIRRRQTICSRGVYSSGHQSVLNIGKVQCQFPISIISTVSSIYLQYLSPISNWLISFIHSIKKHSLQCQVSTSTVIGYFPSQSHVRCASLVVSLGWHTLLHMLGFHKN